MRRGVSRNDGAIFERGRHSLVEGDGGVFDEDVPEPAVKQFDRRLDGGQLVEIVTHDHRAFAFR